jgi:molybdenum cofactor biosynthesis protein B
VRQFDYRQDPCNFVEIMPRLDEHLKRTKLRKKPAPAKRARGRRS